MTVDIDEALARRLIAEQFPAWANLPIQPLNGGWDNRTFRLGDAMCVRLPAAAEYAPQVEKEHRWLPRLAPRLPLPIPTPLAMGKPSGNYNWRWSVYKWLDGEPAALERIADLGEFAATLGRFLAALQRIDTGGGPPPGPHNFHRGGDLATYDKQTREAIAALKGRIDSAAATAIWEAALAAMAQGLAVWLHGDMSAGNLLVDHGRLTAVVDFGNIAVGDPACDLSIAWTLLHGRSRKVFADVVRLHSATWARGRGWALWKALVVMAGLEEAPPGQAQDAPRVLDEILGDPLTGSR